MRITVISDTHNKHKDIELPGGDLLLHAGDISGRGYKHEVQQFCKWFNKQSNLYNSAAFIAGNHDFLFEKEPNAAKEVIESYKWIDYLQDDLLMVGEDYEDMIKIWGTPWQPEFYNWAFNLPKGGPELEYVWGLIPVDTDILITHGPPQGILDTSGNPYNEPNLGCPLLAARVQIVKPKIHIFGHIHGSHGYRFNGDTHFINASVLNEQYNYAYKPITFDWDKETNNIEFIEY